jgi:hypothetical protein
VSSSNSIALLERTSLNVYEADIFNCSRQPASDPLTFLVPANAVWFDAITAAMTAAVIESLQQRFLIVTVVSSYLAIELESSLRLTRSNLSTRKVDTGSS